MRFFLFLSSILAIFFFTSLQIPAFTKDIPQDFSASLKEEMEYSKAISVLLENDISGADSQTQQFLGRLYYLNGESKKARETFTKIKEKSWIDYVYLGLIYEDLSDSGLAIKNYLASLKLKINSIALYRLGKIFYHNKRYRKAAQFFQDTLNCDSSIRLANYYLGECFIKMGNYEKAYSYTARGINFYPDNLKVKSQLGNVKSKLGESFFTHIKQTIEKTRTAVQLLFYGKGNKSPLIKVGLAKDLDDFSFKSGDDFIITDAKKSFKARKNKFYSFVLKNNHLFLADGDKKNVYAKFKDEVTIKSNGYPFYILDVAYGKGNYWHRKIDRAYRGDLKVVSRRTTMTIINILPIEQYLCGVLAAEILPNAQPEALRAQAVAARTLAFSRLNGRHKQEGFDVCADVHCQVYQGLFSETPQTNKAIDKTQGEVLFYQDKPADVIYHNNCGGYLRSDTFGHKDYYVDKFDILPEDKFSQMSPYQEEQWFMSEPISFCMNSPKNKYRWQRVYDNEDFFFIFGFSLEELKKIQPKEKGKTPYYKSIEVIKAGEKININGDLKIRDYFDKLRSSSFKAEIKFSTQGKPKMLIFWGAGFGHGMGMCQDGACSMGQEGHSYREILRHYYPAMKLKKAY